MKNLTQQGCLSRTIFISLALLFTPALSLRADGPALINYQGRVVVGDVNFDGTGQFKFALVNAAGTTTYWSNDGTSTSGSEPSAAVSLSVIKGLYSVLLGDNALGTSMTAIPATVFTQTDLRLRVWFNDGSNGSQRLSPDQRLAPSAYLASGSVTASDFAVAGVPSTGQVLGFNGTGLTWSAPGGGVFSLNGTNAYYNGGNVGIGTSSPTTPLEVRTGTGVLGLSQSDGTRRVGTYVGGGGGTDGGWIGTISNHPLHLFVNNGAPQMSIISGAVGIGTAAPANRLHVYDPTSSTAEIIETGGGTNSWAKVRFKNLNGQWDIGTSRGFSGDAFYIDRIGTTALEFQIFPDGDASFLGNVGIGTATPAVNLDVRGSGLTEATVWSTGERAILSLNSTLGGNNRIWTLENGLSGSPGLFGIYDRTSAQARLTITPAGNVGIGTTSPQANLDVRGSAPTEATVWSTNEKAILSLNSTLGGVNRIWTLESGLFSSPGLFGIYDRTAGKARLTIDTSGIVSVGVLRITGGADLAEPFPMKEAALEKGSVVVIDPERPGQLRRSTIAYDRRVAGIVSGANGINPGIALHQEGVVEGDQNVALSGRVYVTADASASPIQPGDLLTTSDTPGHAMKVVDQTRAQGAVIGKAMTSLEGGTGMVLVLVTLQ